MHLYSLLAMKWYPILFDTPLNAVRSVAIWLTLALLIGFVACTCLLKGEKKRKFLKIGLIFFIAYACLLGALYLLLSFLEDGIQAIVFIPLVILLLSIAVGSVLLTLKKKILRIAVYTIIAAAIIATLVCVAIYFDSGKAAEFNWLTNEDVNGVGLYISAILTVAAVIFATFWFGRKEKSGFDAKTLAYAGVCVAMSFSLSYLRIVRMPQGGSITPASMLPLMIFAYAFGVKKGVFVGAVYGLLQALQSSSGLLHPAQFLLDYPIAFSCVGFAGVFSHTKALQKYPQAQIALGGVVMGLSRFVMHFLSGVFAFGIFAGDAPVVLYSLGYQAAYVLPDMAITIVVALFVFSSKNLVKELRRMNPPKLTED